MDESNEQRSPTDNVPMDKRLRKEAIDAKMVNEMSNGLKYYLIS